MFVTLRILSFATKIVIFYFQFFFSVWDDSASGKPYPNQKIYCWKVKFENIDIENELTLSIWSYELIIKWSKKGLKVKLVVWFPTIKMQETWIN